MSTQFKSILTTLMQAVIVAWAVFNPVNIEADLPLIYNLASVYLYLRGAHFYVVASVRASL